jgi:hypothetical protein
MAKRRTVITIETDRMVIRGSRPTALWCERCAAGAPMVTPEYAARLSGTTPRAIYRMVESGELHYLETPSGGLLICCVSLQKGE